MATKIKTFNLDTTVNDHISGLTVFDNSTTGTHPAANGNFDLAQGESPFVSLEDVFGVKTISHFDQMDPRGSTVTVDLGSVA